MLPPDDNDPKGVDWALIERLLQDREAAGQAPPAEGEREIEAALRAMHARMTAAARSEGLHPRRPIGRWSVATLGAAAVVALVFALRLASAHPSGALYATGRA